MRQLWSCTSVLSVSELIIGHTGGVERIVTIIIKIKARLGPPGDRMKRFEVIWGRSITQNLVLKCGRYSGTSPQSLKVGSFDRGAAPGSDGMRVIVRDAQYPNNARPHFKAGRRILARRGTVSDRGQRVCAVTPQFY